MMLYVLPTSAKKGYSNIWLHRLYNINLILFIFLYFHYCPFCFCCYIHTRNLTIIINF
jgi:hypothetical protein